MVDRRQDPEDGYHARVIDGEIADGYEPPSASMDPKASAGSRPGMS